jgi:Holliday junction resolvasome RuvABC ATP-dependent DNA helicase subunit
MEKSYFTLEELQESQIATAKGIINVIPPELEINFQTLINDVLNPIRYQFGKPINVSSGYRCKELNEAVGGVSTSHHTGINGSAAADITVGKRGDNKILFQLIYKMVKSKEISVDQLINENNYLWIHISTKINKKQNRNQIFAI